ncbi:hypothetical protein ANO11243_043380 [Dothideomycetidae sp. 11243]|nr:hypothetical protein ANO11243_043380 [fungal sp. No.11243]
MVLGGLRARLTATLQLLDPFLWISISLFFFPLALTNLILTFQFRKLLSWHALQHAWFGRFWAWMGPQVRLGAAPHVDPLVTASAKGVVLDIGPASGQWLYLYATEHNPAITRIYGVEPNTEHHPALRRAVKAAGLEDKYRILDVGAEGLRAAGVELSSVDTIVTVQVLCSIPDPKRVIRELYSYLKPGGRWIVYEHVQTPYVEDFRGWWQKKISPIWSFCFDGCCITRPTEAFLKDAGSWSKINLKPRDDDGEYAVLPHTMGYLVKS